MSYFTAKMLKEARNNAGLSQEDVAAVLKISKRKVAAMEKDENPILVDDLIQLSYLYKIDVREFLFESYIDQGEEQVLFNRYASVFRLFDQLSDKDKEDVVWVLKQRIKGYI
ncbi:MAG: helix-turn-helix transcriptional regulator [Butyrivibrio hungatei]|nr:helix-turn-helix transcriptional regulator [Butyrivibrio hungatei]